MIKIPLFFLINPDGTTTELTTEGQIKDVLKTDECYVLVADDIRKVYFWKGIKSSVRSKFIGAKRSQEIRGMVGMHYSVIPLDEGDEDPEFLKAFGMRSNDNEGSVSPFIFKPPTPPGDLSPSGEPQAKQPIKKEEEEYEPYCKHCGSNLPEGQTICHVCGKKVI